MIDFNSDDSFSLLQHGYLNLPEKTRDRFIPNPFATAYGATQPGPRALLYKTGINKLELQNPSLHPPTHSPTHRNAVLQCIHISVHSFVHSLMHVAGDLARLSPGGDIEYCGRIDSQVKIRGYRVELAEIESVLCEHPKVSGAVVDLQEVGEGADKDTQLVAFLLMNMEPDAKRACEKLEAAIRDMQLGRGGEGGAGELSVRGGGLMGGMVASIHNWARVRVQ